MFPVKKSKDTLKLIIPKANPSIDQRIIEIGLGSWEGMKKSNVPKDILINYRNELYVQEGAETTLDVDTRVYDFIMDIYKTFKENDKILVVTYNGVMRSIKRQFIEN